MNIKKIIDDLKSIDFANIDLQQPGQWPYLFKIFACVFCFIITIMLGNFLYLDNIESKEVAATLKEKQLKNEYKIKYFQSANLIPIQQQVTDIKKMLESIITQLPTDTEVPSLLEDISNSAKSSGLNIDLIRLKEEKQEDYYIVLPIHITVKGNYHQFGNFVSKISNLSRLVALEDFEISKNNHDGVLTLNIVAKTYRYQKQGEN
jgi:type IV pilus assembly protein PilO